MTPPKKNYFMVIMLILFWNLSDDQVDLHRQTWSQKWLAKNIVQTEKRLKKKKSHNFSEDKNGRKSSVKRKLIVWTFYILSQVTPAELLSIMQSSLGLMEECEWWDGTGVIKERERWGEGVMVTRQYINTDTEEWLLSYCPLQHRT